jgi:integrase
MREDLALRGMSAGTIVTYVGCARRFAEHFGRSPSRMGAAEVREFLLHLAGRVRPNTFNGYVSALRFLYGVTLARPEDGATLPRMRVPMHLPTVLTGVEVEQILGALASDKHRAVVMLAYGAGLRISEACHLRVEDIDAKRMLLHIRNAKRGRERYVMRSRRLLRALRAYWKRARPTGPYVFRGAELVAFSRAEPCTRRSSGRRERRASPRPCRRTRCATASRLTCWSATRTFATSK